MNDYPSSSPWGPHGPQVNVPSTTPNPTAQDPVPSLGSDVERSRSVAVEPSPYAPPSGERGGAGAGGPARDVGGTGAELPFGRWMLNLAVVGAVIGALVGAGRGMLLHQPPSATGMMALRLGLAGAAAGAGLPPFLRAALLAARAALWIGLAVVLWAAALALTGQIPWLARYLP